MCMGDTYRFVQKCLYFTHFPRVTSVTNIHSNYILPTLNFQLMIFNLYLVGTLVYQRSTNKMVRIFNGYVFCTSGSSLMILLLLLLCMYVHVQPTTMFNLCSVISFHLLLCYVLNESGRPNEVTTLQMMKKIDKRWVIWCHVYSE